MSEAAHDLMLDTVETPPVSAAQEMAESPPPPELMLRLDDLSQDGTQIGSNEERKSNEGESPLQQAPGRQVDRDTKRMETQLQRNLKQQQTHYARQRKLFENLRAESSPSSNSSNSPQSSDDQVPIVRQLSSSPRKLVNAAKAKFRLQKERIGTLSRQRTEFSRDNHRHPPSSSPEDDDDDDDDDSHAQLMLRRIKEKARAEFYRQHSSTEESSIDVGATARSKAPTEFFEEMQQQEASNDALRRQLELLRRLQLENNRFRQETRSLRDRNEALKERDEIREREVKRLREDVSELEAKIQRDQKTLATAAQTQHKVKMYQKRLTAAQAEIRDFQAALQEANDRIQAARDARDHLQSESQLEISDLVLEVKRWKRNTKQLRQQETRSGEEIAICKKTIAALEEESSERRAKLKDAKREIAEMATLIDEKTAECESVETSAADCVKRMEEGLEALQKTHSHEREKRKKVESVRSNMQMQMERMQAENALLLDKQRELEQQLTRFQEHWKERKLAYQDQLQRFAAQLEEHVTKHKSDAATIGRLRDEYEALENHLGAAEAGAIELKTAVVEEARAAQRQVEALRKYVEKSLHDGDDSTLETPLDSGRSRREEGWQEVPELQVVQAALSALRNEISNIVHEFQRARHLVRQQGSKLTLAVERLGELEHLREEDAAKMKELREQRKLAEQAREIVAQEKVEVLKWSEQQCEKNEALEAEVKKCGQLVFHLRKFVHDALKTDVVTVTAEPLAQSFSSLEKEVDALVSVRDHWRKESEKLSHEVKEAQSQLRAMEKEIAVKAVEFKETLEEVERVHNENAAEQKCHFEQCVADVDNERAALEEKLEEKSTKLTEEQETNTKLQQLVVGFEEDLPVFATILHLFVLVAQPLLLQVSDLLAQKRYLVRENAEFTHSQEQIECIGRVLKEMIPTPAPSQEKTKERQRRRVFRRVVIAVFAMNRFRHFTDSTADVDEPSESVYGLPAPLKAVKSRKRTCATSSLPTVIKVLPPQQTLSKLSLRSLLERLKKMEITEKVAEVMESNSPRSPSCLGNLILKVVMAVNPASKKLLSANTNGIFHCEALLERRRSSKKRSDDNDDMTEYESTAVCEDDMPTVALIRKRILALGKRVEDLHYQRNALQKENYEFQFQLDQQANSLKEMEVQLKKTEDLQEELAAVRSQNDQELQNAQQERQAKDQAIQSKENELVEAKATIGTLQAEVSESERRIETMESDKTSLQRELDLLKSSSVEEEVKADKSKATARRQEEEVRSLKQAVKKAHELYQKVTWQLEQEVQEKSTLQTMVNHLRQHQEKAERELREEKLRELEKSFDEDDDSDEDVKESYAKARKLRRSYEMKVRDLKSTRSATFASTNAGKSRRTCDNSLSRRHQCENSGIAGASDESENGSPTSAAVSPLSLRVNSNKSRYSEEVDKFLNEWQQLGVSGVLNDTASPRKEGHVRFQSDGSEMGGNSPAKSLESVPKSKRRVEIDKVNTAVHDYMDRIDDKLNKMYGIPPSSAIQRSTNRYDSNVSKSLETRRNNEADWDTCMKANEVGVQQYHSDVGTYD